MNVIFYTCSNAPNEYPKSFGTGVTVDCDLLEPTSTKSPVLKMTQANAPIGKTHAGLWGAKYVVLNDFKYDRGFVYVRLVRSALDTWWSTVASCNCHITRCKNGEKYLIDNMATQLEGDKIGVKKVGTAFTKGCQYVFIKGVSQSGSSSS